MAKLREEYKIYDSKNDGYVGNVLGFSKQYARIWKSLSSIKTMLKGQYLKTYSDGTLMYKNGLKDIPDSWILCSYNTETGYKEMKVKDLFDDSTNKTVV